MTAMTPTAANPINPAPNWLQWAPTLERFVPRVAGGAGDDGDDGEGDGTGSGTGGASAEGLAALQAQIDAAAKTAGTAAANDLAKTLGFDTPDALQTFVTAQRAAAEAAKTEDQKRADALAASEKAAADRERAAAELINRGTVNLALVRAGVAPDAVDKIAPLVTVNGDVTAETADAAVAALKADDTFAALFGAAKAPAPSGVTGDPPAKGSNVVGIESGAELYARRHPAKTA